MNPQQAFSNAPIKSLSGKCPKAKCALWVWVVDKNTRKALPGAKITVTGPSSPRGQLPKTGPSTFNNLTAGTYQVTATATHLTLYEKSTANTVTVTIDPGDTGHATIEVDVPAEAVALLLIDHEGLPVAAEAYGMTAPNGAVVNSKLTSAGSRRINPIRPGGDCKFKFPQLDSDIWEFVESTAGTVIPPQKGEAVTPAAETLASPHSVVAGDCIHSIAYRAGIPVNRIWNAGPNAALKKLRKDAGVLMPGDSVTIPAKRTDTIATKPTEFTHKFRRKETCKEYKLQVLMGENPRDDVTCEVTVDGKKVDVKKSGTWVSFMIRPDAKEAVVTLSYVLGKVRAKQLLEKFEYKIKLGHLRPADTQGGQEDRLQDLGYYDSWADGKAPSLEDVLHLFQLSNEITPADGKANPATLKKLKELTGDPS